MSRLAVSLCAVVLFGALAAPAMTADVRYRITDLGELANDRMRAVTFTSGINDRTEVVGQSFNAQLQARAYLWRGGQMTDLGDMGGQLSALEAFAINKKSQVVGGGIDRSGTPRAFFWEKNRMIDLALLGNGVKGAFAWSINSHGDIVGAGYNAAGMLRAVRWVKRKPLELGALPDGRAAVQAFGISDKGQVVGYLAPGGKVSFAHAFSWKAGKFVDLGTLPRTNLSFANAVNEQGQVVGQSYDTTVPGTSRAFLWEDGTMLDLGVAAAAHTRSEARAVGKKGTVVGMSGIASDTVGWIWREGVIQDLNKLVMTSDASRPYVRLTSALAINDREQITAEGVDQRTPGALRAYLLTPAR